MGRTTRDGDPLPRDADVGCIACGRSLRFLADAYPLAFHCDNGHFLTVQDLLNEILPRASALDSWQGKTRLLQDLAGRALASGHALAAADFQETAGRIDRWVGHLRKLLSPPAPRP